MNFVGNTIFRLNCLNSELKNICFFNRADILLLRCRGVAQPGRVLAWGARGRRFESCHPDQIYITRDLYQYRNNIVFLYKK